MSPGTISAHRPRKTSSPTQTLAIAAGAGRQPCARNRAASGASSVASRIEMITGRTRSIIRAAPSATTTIPATTISARSVIADATAKPCGTASSPLNGAGRCARPFDGRGVCSGVAAILLRGFPAAQVGQTRGGIVAPACRP